MLNEAPKKKKKEIDYSHPTKWQLFWRTQRECWRRMVTPYLMYFFMSLLAFSAQAINNTFAKIALGVLCIAGGAFFNGHLMYNCGVYHYGFYVSGMLHRRNELFGIHSGGDHRPEREYRPWKGFYIGFLIGVPVIVLGTLAGVFFQGGLLQDGSVSGMLANSGGNYAALALLMFAAWAILPVTWLNNYAHMSLNLAWSIVMIVVPFLVSGVFYLFGAYKDRMKREEETARAARVEEAGERAKREMHEQTEEQRRKTLQSKKKK